MQNQQELEEDENFGLNDECTFAPRLKANALEGYDEDNDKHGEDRIDKLFADGEVSQSVNQSVNRSLYQKRSSSR